MWKLELIVLFSVFAPFVYIDTINGLWIAPVATFHQPNFQLRTSEQSNLVDANIETLPTPVPFQGLWDPFHLRKNVDFMSKEFEKIKDIKTDVSPIGKYEKGNEETKGMNAVFPNHEKDAVKFKVIKVKNALHRKMNTATNSRSGLWIAPDTTFHQTNFQLQSSDQSNLVDANIETQPTPVPFQVLWDPFRLRKNDDFKTKEFRKIKDIKTDVSIIGKYEKGNEETKDKNVVFPNHEKDAVKFKVKKVKNSLHRKMDTATNSRSGLWIAPDTTFHQSNFQLQTLDQSNLVDASIETQPTPVPFQGLWDPFYLRKNDDFKTKEFKKIKDIKTDVSIIGKYEKGNEETKGTNAVFLNHEKEAVKFKVIKVKNSLHSKMKNTTINNTEETLTADTPHHVKKKFMVRLSLSKIFRSLFDPLARISTFRYFHSNHSENQEILKKKTDEDEKRNTTNFSDVQLEKMNKTENDFQNWSTMKSKSFYLLFGSLKCIGKIFLMILIACMTVLFSLPVVILLLVSVLYIFGFLVYLLKYLHKFLVVFCYTKKQPGNRHIVGGTDTISIAKPLTV